MDLPTSSSSKDFSSIARRLLLKRGASCSSNAPLFMEQDIHDDKPPIERPIAVSHPVFPVGLKHGEQPIAVSHPVFPVSKRQAEKPTVASRSGLPVSRKRNQQSSLPVASVPAAPIMMDLDFSDLDVEPPYDECTSVTFCFPNNIADRFREIRMEMLMAPMEKDYKPVKKVAGKTRSRPSMGKRARVIVGRVRLFFEELKRQLGKSCRGTILNSSLQLTALACGVAQITVRRSLLENDLCRPLVQMKNRHGIGIIPDPVLRKYEEEWGDYVYFFITNRLTDENMTVEALHSELLSAYRNFPMSKATLYRFLKALGITCCRDNDHIRISLSM